MLIIKNGKWYCETHQIELEICINRKNGSKFLKCPYNKNFECGTINEGQFNPNDYEYYTPNLKNKILNEMCRQISDDDVDYFDSSKFNNLF